MTKEGAIACLKGNSYSAAEVKRLIESIDVKEKYQAPKYLKVGDIYLNAIGGGVDKFGNLKRRPCVIVSVKEDIVLSIPLTSTENSMCLVESKYRFGRDGFFTKSLIAANKEYALQNFCGIYDSPKRLRKVIREMKQYLNNTI